VAVVALVWVLKSGIQSDQPAVVVEVPVAVQPSPAPETPVSVSQALATNVPLSLDRERALMPKDIKSAHEERVRSAVESQLSPA
jgi:hypothetical protein